jgi:hypothetical protein
MLLSIEFMFMSKTRTKSMHDDHETKSCIYTGG